jgi:hypothetical protein
MQIVTTIGLDIAKSVFQGHGVDAAGQMVIRRKLKRRYVLAFFQKLPPCLIARPSLVLLAAHLRIAFARWRSSDSQGWQRPSHSGGVRAAAQNAWQ